MGKVKISELPVASAVNPTDLIEIVQGGTNKQVVSSLIGGNQTLDQVLANGRSTGNLAIQSPTHNGELDIRDNYSKMTFSDGVTSGYSYIDELTNEIQHDTKVVLNAPNINIPNETASQIAYLDASKNLKTLPVATYPSLTELAYVKGLTSNAQTQITARELTANKDASGGYAGLTLFKINFKNVANTFTSFFTNSNTASRTYTFKDADGTVAFTSDITGTNSGTNTGDETAARIGAIVNGATSYTTPLDADKIGIWDTANSLFKAVTWANIKATLAGYFSSYQNIQFTTNATPTIAIGTFRETFVDITAQAANITSVTITGTPTNGAKLTIVIKPTSTISVALGSSFEARGVNLPTSALISKRLTSEYRYDTTTSKFGCVGVVQEF